MTGRTVSRAAGGMVIAGGLAVLAGWIFDIRILKEPLPNTASMTANAAIAFVLSGFALRAAATRGATTLAAPLLGLLVALIGLLTLSQDVVGWNLGLDELLFTDIGTTPTSAPGRMAPTSSLCFFAIGIAFIASPRRSSSAQGLAHGTALVSAIAVVGYLYNVRGLYGAGPYSTMAVHSAVLLLALSIGVLLWEPPGRIMSVVLDSGLGGTATRRLLPIAMTVPVIFGWLQLQGERAGLYAPEFGFALTAVLTISVFAVVIWWSARSLQVSDVARQEAVRELSRLTASLEQRVSQKTEALALREAQLRLVTETAHDAFVAIDFRGRVIDWNPQAERLFGWPRATAFGMLLSDLIIPARFREAHTRGLERFLATGQGRIVNTRIELMAAHRDGHELPVEITIAPVQMSGAWRFNAFIRSLTESKVRRDATEATAGQHALASPKDRETPLADGPARKR